MHQGWGAAVESELCNAAMVQETVLAGAEDGSYATGLVQLESARSSSGQSYFGEPFFRAVSATGGQRQCMTPRSSSVPYLAFSSDSGLVSNAVPVDPVFGT